MNIALKHLENARANINAEKEIEVAKVKERVLREIQPKYIEIDNISKEEKQKISNAYAENRALATQEYNAHLVAMQTKFEEDTKCVTDLAEKRKNEILNAELQKATYEITKNCDIDNLISKIKDKE